MSKRVDELAEELGIKKHDVSAMTKTPNVLSDDYIYLKAGYEAALKDAMEICEQRRSHWDDIAATGMAIAAASCKGGIMELTEEWERYE